VQKQKIKIYPSPARNLCMICYMVSGIQKAKDIKLNEISRALCEDIVVTKVYGQLIERAMTTTL
jgi:hypothetical protein